MSDARSIVKIYAEAEDFKRIDIIFEHFDKATPPKTAAGYRKIPLKKKAFILLEQEKEIFL